MAKYQPPGVIVVVHRDRRTHFFPFGTVNRRTGEPVTPATVFELASITKVFTTTSLAIEVHNGRMRLDDRVAKHLPEFRDRPVGELTLQHLATHTSALPREPAPRPRGGWNRERLWSWLHRWTPPYPPGTKSLYSNVAVGLLGHILERFEERPLIEVWRRQFLNPLEMHHTFFGVPPRFAPLVTQGYGPHGRAIAPAPDGAWPAGGRLRSSGHDMAKFLVANLGERTDRPIISEAMHLAQEPRFKAGSKMTLGLAWQRLHVDGALLIDKNGGLDGTSTYIGMLPEEGLGVVVMANRGKCQGTQVGRDLLMAIAEKSGEIEPADDEPAEPHGEVDESK